MKHPSLVWHWRRFWLFKDFPLGAKLVFPDGQSIIFVKAGRLIKVGELVGISDYQDKE